MAPLTITVSSPAGERRPTEPLVGFDGRTKHFFLECWLGCKHEMNGWELAFNGATEEKVYNGSLGWFAIGGKLGAQI